MHSYLTLVSLNINVDVPVAKGRRKICRITTRCYLVCLKGNIFRHVGEVIVVNGIFSVSKPCVLKVQLSGG